MTLINKIIERNDLKLNRRIRYPFSLSDVCWLLFGLMLMMPFELVEGLFFGYFLILVALLTGTAKYDKVTICLVLILISFVVVSTLFNNDSRFTAILNPALTALVFLVPRYNVRQYEMIKKGIYVSAFMSTLILMWGLSQQGTTSAYVLLTDRDWGIKYLPYFGNGMALIFSVAMLFAFKDGRYKLFLIIMIGALLTTSRTPIVVFVVIIFIWFVRNPGIKYVTITIAIVALMPSLFWLSSSPVLEELRGLQDRAMYSEDRLQIWRTSFIIISENLFFGIGAEKLPVYDHAHNSFIQIALKNGIFFFIIWTILIFKLFFSHLDWKNNVEFFVIFMIIGTVQIGLHHPNVLLALLIYCRTRELSHQNAASG